MFKFIKSIFAENKPVNSNQNLTDKGANKAENFDSYGCISRYDKKIADYIRYKNVPQYAVDWLADSIKNGATIEFTAIYDSIDNGIPYLCETEEELWLFEKDDNPLINSPEGINTILLMYKHGNLKNINKFNYWMNRLLSLASSGNRMAQGIICWDCGFIRSDGKYDGCIPQHLWTELKSRYESNLLNACNNGDPYCQLSVAKYYKEISNDIKESLYKAAIAKGLTDACYYYANFLNQKRFFDNKMVINVPPYGTDEWQKYMRIELGLYKTGAELNNGVMAGYCQYRLADMYRRGDGGVFKDESMAQIWYKKAYENGYKKAKNYIDK